MIFPVNIASLQTSVMVVNLFLQVAEKSPLPEPENDAKSAQKGEMKDCTVLPCNICTAGSRKLRGRQAQGNFYPFLYFLQIRVCWLKYVSTRSGTQAKSLQWRRINRVFVGKWSLIMYPDPHLKIDGKILCLCCFMGGTFPEHGKQSVSNTCRVVCVE